MNRVFISVGKKAHCEYLLQAMMRSDKYKVVAAVQVEDQLLSKTAADQGVELIDSLEAREVGYFDNQRTSDALDDCADELMFMMRRLINIGCVNNDVLMEYISKTVGYWEWWINDRKIDTFIFGAVPHEFYDYIIYLLAKKSGKKTLFLEKTFWPNKIIIGRDHRVDGYDAIKCSNPAIDDAAAIKAEMMRAKNNEAPYWTKAKLKVNSSHIVSHWLRSIINGRFRLAYPGFYGKRYVKNDELKDKNVLWNVFWRIIISLKKIVLLIEYFLFSTACEKKYKKSPCIVFFLQVQPEKSTSPLGGEYCDQLHAVRSVMEWLPANVTLLVREHPSQMKRFQSLHKGRDIGFYYKIRQAGATLLGPGVEKDALYHSSMGVVTVNGSVALEAYMRGIHSCYMGYPWYSGLKGLPSARSKEEFDAFIKKCGMQFDGQDVEDDIYSYYSGLTNGVFERFNLELHKDSVEQWSAQIFDCIDGYLPCVD